MITIACVFLFVTGWTKVEIAVVADRTMVVSVRNVLLTAVAADGERGFGWRRFRTNGRSRVRRLWRIGSCRKRLADQFRGAVGEVIASLDELSEAMVKIVLVILCHYAGFLQQVPIKSP